MITRPALRYHGGKFRIADWVISHMPEHRKYVEPFGGAASVLLLKPRAYAEVYNDLDGDIVNFFRVLQNDEQRSRLIALCELTPYARAEFELAYQETGDPIERARRTAIRASMGFGSAGASKNTTGFRIDTDREYGTAMSNWVEYPKSIDEIGKRLMGVLIENRPAIDVMRQHDRDDVLHFIDPPYLPETRNSNGKMYRHEMTEGDHEILLESVKSLNGMAMVSGYASELYKDMLADWKMVTKKARISAARGSRCKLECMWLSPKLVANLKKPEQLKVFV